MSHESKILNVRTLAAAFWATFFTLEWLLLLNVVETTTATIGVLVIHFVFAGMLSGMIAMEDTPQRRKGGNGRK